MLERLRQRRLAVSLALAGFIFGTFLPACGGEPEAKPVVPEVVNASSEEIPPPALGQPFHLEMAAPADKLVDIPPPEGALQAGPSTTADFPPEEVAKALEKAEADKAAAQQAPKTDAVGLPVGPADPRTSPGM